MARRKSTPGISRIDQPERRTHGFFVRLTRQGKIHSAFFPDLRYGGKGQAFAAAQRHYDMLLEKYGKRSRQAWARRVRRKGASGITGVRKVYRIGKGRRYDYWQASWSPLPHVVAKKQFAISKYGSRLAKLLARIAREEGLQSMAD